MSNSPSPLDENLNKYLNGLVQSASLSPRQRKKLMKKLTREIKQ